MCVKCKQYQRTIQALCHDKTFGIMTRNGLEYNISKIKSFRGMQIALMDFCNLSKMNQNYGYEEVNKRFTELFCRINRSKLLVGRCFSGDEIIIIGNNINIVRNSIALLLNNKLGLSFRYFIKPFYGNLKSDLRQMYNKMEVVNNG